jgi:hypothetical protein
MGFGVRRDQWRESGYCKCFIRNWHGILESVRTGWGSLGTAGYVLGTCSDQEFVRTGRGSLGTVGLFCPDTWLGEGFLIEGGHLG